MLASSTSLPARACGRVRGPAQRLAPPAAAASRHGPPPRRRRLALAAQQQASSSSSSSAAAKPGAAAPGAAAGASSSALYPAGAKSARMETPALLLVLQAGAVLGPEGEAQLAAVNEAVTAGATGVLLDGSDSAAALYDAALKLRELLRERAALLLLDRLDIAAAVGAEGVVLSRTGVPVVVARKMQAGPLLLGQLVSSAAAAVAAAADGANFVLLQAESGAPPEAAEVAAARRQQRSGNAIPVLASSAAGAAAGEALRSAVAALAAPADGFCLPLEQLAPAAGGGAAAPAAAVGCLLQALTEEHTPEAGGGSAAAGTATVRVAGGSALRRLLDASKETLIAEERRLLQAVVALLEDVVPQMDELPLLRDAIANLDDVFLVVVVGEFNSGKSTVINALLGERFLADGILPTTNEISVLKYAEPGSGKPELLQQADGLFVRHLPAALLKEMNIVDTPGTNVILERQQRLTEEYVPRADLVLFVLSADRPLSESELGFLRYIRQWRKKVVFVVNKIDMFEAQSEVEAVLGFVASNASKLLQLDAPAVLPISGRAALKAKLACGSGQSGGVLDSWEDDLLQGQPGWQASRFGEFEKFIYDFLVGSEAAAAGAGGSLRGGEGLRLKLQTPLYVADALLGAAGVRLESELGVAQAELAALEAVRRQLARFKGEMAKDAEAQRQACVNLVGEALSRNAKFVDRTLQLSNLPALTGYLVGGAGKEGTPGPVSGRWDAEVVAGTFDQMAKQVAEHAAWLSTNCSNQVEYYAAYLQQHAMPSSSGGGSWQQQQAQQAQLQQASSSGQAAPPATAASSSSAAAAASAVSSTDAAAAVAAASGSRSLAAVAEFSPDAARRLLEEEIREAFLGTAGSAAGAQGLGLLAAGWLGNTLEDLLALTVAGLASYVAVLNLPLKRADIKAKVSRVANNFADGVTAAMEEEANAAVDGAIARVLARVEPLEAAWRSELLRLQGNEQRRAQLADELAGMEKRTANLQ